MLDNIEEIAIAYLTQKSHYLNGFIGNSFVVRKNRKFIAGIIDGRYNPAALNGCHLIVKWGESPIAYFKYFVTRLTYRQLKSLLYRVGNIRKALALMMVQFPEKYGSLYFEFFYMFDNPISMLQNPNILNIGSTSKIYMISVIRLYKFNIIPYIYNLLKNHILARGTVTKPEYFCLSQYYKNGLIRENMAASKAEHLGFILSDLKKYGDLDDLDQFVVVLQNERKTLKY